MNLKTKITALIMVAVLTTLAVYVYVESGRIDYPSFPYLTNVSGVNVYSKIPVPEFQTRKNVYLFTSEGKAATSCNFEISAVSKPDRRGYEIHMEEGPLGVYIGNDSAYIRGETDEELLRACHAFVCLREGIECPKNLSMIQNIILRQTDLILVIDNKTGAAAIRGYTELFGVLGFIQAQIVDVNKNGVVEQEEVDSNEVWIYPYIMEGEFCTLMPFKNAIEELNITNDTTRCDFNSGIYLVKSDRNEIRIEGNRTFIFGDDEHIHSGAVIVRDVLSPEWIRVYYGVE